MPIAKWCHMPDEPRVSIITAVYNGARTILETIASVRAQSEPAWEHLIVDDGSTDATAAVVRAAADARTAYHYQPHAGRSVARNRALDLARGEFALFLDADDWLLPQALREHLAYFAAHPDVDVSVSDGDICTDDGRTLATFGTRRGAPAADTDVSARLLVDPGLIGAPPVAMVRIAAIRRGGVRFDPEQSVEEDTLFWIALAQHARFGFHGARTCRYRWHSGGTILGGNPDILMMQRWRARQQMLAAPFFTHAPHGVREFFFYQVLVLLLRDHPAEQASLAASPQFADLSAAARARLLRLAASEHLLSRRHVAPARRLLEQAVALAPADRSARLLLALARISPRAARLAVAARRWRKRPPLDPLFAPALSPTERAV
jgi:glycosyltransferase involved in cell wall biosynthesis